MPVSVVVGGQFGSEGKGKIAAYLVNARRAEFAVRVGGPNSGHTVIDSNGVPRIFHQLPTASLQPDVVSVIPPGCYLNCDILLREIELTNATPQRLAIDPHAWLVTAEDIDVERQGSLQGAIGSTASGMGASVVRRVKREGRATFAKEVPALSQFLRDTSELLNKALSRGKRIVIEGTQGFGLSLLHSRDYPYCTSRDTTAAAFVAEAGLSPIDVDEVVLVVRAFPIRVAGASGPLPDEIDWQTLTTDSGSPERLIEYTSVTKKVRRVARFDKNVVVRAIAQNRPTLVVLNHIDYIDGNVRTTGQITRRAESFIEAVSHDISMPVNFVGLGPNMVLPWSSKNKKVSHL